MRKSIIILFTLSIVSCSEDDSIEQSSGSRLVSIEYTHDDDTWNEKYSYDLNNELYQIENSRTSTTRYEVEYESGELKEVSTFRGDENKLIFRDSFLYNDNGTIKEIHNFSINSGPNLPLSWISEFNYDSEGRVIQKQTYYVRTAEYISIEKYYWKDDNIERVEYRNEDNELYYEYFYTYDDKKSYFRQRPINMSDPITWSDNNVTEMNWNDYVGNLDINCRPCSVKYKYNFDDYPVSIKMNWGQELVLEYE